MRDDPTRIQDIQTAITKIEERLPSDKAAFLADEVLQVWVLHHLMVIGEAAANISEELREFHSDLPWRDMIALRNIVAHRYWGVDFEEIWSTITIDLPPLKKRLADIFR